MRLYSRSGAVVLEDPEFGRFEADELGGFDLPDDLSDRLHGFAVAGRPLWETDIERQRRLMAEEKARRQDPETLLSAVEQLMRAAQAATPGASSPGAATPKTGRPRKSAASKPATG